MTDAPPSKKCAVYLENKSDTGTFNLRVSRFPNAPLLSVWVQEVGRGSRGIILDYDDVVELVESLNDILDDWEEAGT